MKLTEARTESPLTLQEVEELVGQIETLPALPAVLAELMQAMERSASEVDLNRVIELVSLDESVAGQCLHMANSALFGRHSRVETVHEAVVILGLWRVNDIVFSCTLPDIFEPFPKSIDRSTFWRHALGCALMSQRLAQLVRSCSAEKAYLAGLLHDLGMIVNAALFPVQSTAAFESAAKEAVAFDKVERQVLGFSHADTGRMLGQAWNLSPDIVTVLQFHHDLEAADSAKDLVAIVHLSDLFCRERGLGYGYAESRKIDFTCSPAWLMLVQTCRRMGRPHLTRFFKELEAYFEEVVKFVDAAFSRPSP